MLLDMCRRKQWFIVTDRYIASLFGWHLSHSQRVMKRVLKVDHLFWSEVETYRKGVRNMRKPRRIFLNRDHR